MKENKKVQKDILFLFPPAGRFSKLFDVHLGVAYLQAYLKEKGINSQQIIFNNPFSYSDVFEKIQRFKPKFIGFTCYFTNYKLIKILVLEIKKKFPDIKIILGGPEPTASYDLILKSCKDIDVCVIRYGEEVCYKLINLLKQGTFNTEELKKVPNIAFMEKGKVILTSDDYSLYSMDLDKYPSPYLKGFVDCSKEIPGVITSRGCPYNCTYCNFASMSNKKIRFHSIKRIISELKFIEKNLKDKSRVVNIRDDYFGFTLDRAKKICEEIITQNIKLKLHCMLRADKVDEELFVLMKAAGFVSIMFGLESGSPKVLRNIKKVFFNPKDKDFAAEKSFLENIKKYTNLAKKMGFSVCVSVIEGLPGETKEDFIQTINFLNKLNIDEYIHNHLIVFRGSEIYKRCSEYNLDFDEQWYRPFIVSDRLKIQKFLKTDIAKKCINLKIISKKMKEQLRSWISKAPVANLQIFFREDSKYTPLLFDWFMKELRYPLNIFLEYSKWESILPFLNKLPVSYLHFNKIEKINSKKYLIIDDFKNIVDINKKNYLEIEDQEKNILSYFDKRFIEEKIEFDNIRYFKHIPSKENKALLNVCKWTNSCPGLKTKQLILGNNNNIFVCNNKFKIGKVGESLEKLNDNFTKIYDNEKINNNCKSCKAYNYCPKCICLNSLDKSEYCSIVRKNPQIIILFSLLNELNKSKGSNILILNKGNSYYTCLTNHAPKEIKKKILKNLDFKKIF